MSKHVPYALGEAGMSRDRMQEEAAEDQHMRALEAGESPPVIGPLPEWSSTEQVATHIKRSAKTVRRYIKEGKLKAKGSKYAPYRIHRSEVERLMTISQEPVAKGPRQRRAKPSGGGTLKDLVNKDDR
jgi:hypothetical protein